jgi:hypothetical protein
VLRITTRDFAALRTTAIRIVEAQHRVATLKLVDSVEEHAVLEDLIEQSKPAVPADDVRGMHYLLATPFRYPPLRHGSRFGRRHERGIWYASEHVDTALAEAAYYRFVFLAGTTAAIGFAASEHTIFSVGVASERAVDLTVGRFVKHRAELASPSDYRATQEVGAALRAAGVELFRYASARDRQGRANLGVFAPRAFLAKQPHGQQTWHCAATDKRVVFTRRDLVRNRQVEFESAQFLVGGELPFPAG